MKIEIERKYLVKTIPENLEQYVKLPIRQGYLSIDPEIRIRSVAGRHILTIKENGNLSRGEFEIDINYELFTKLASSFSDKFIYKDRYMIPLDGYNIAELDMYNNVPGLISTVEVEFDSLKSAESFVAPDWFGTEITNDSSYKNKNLVPENHHEDNMTYGVLFKLFTDRNKDISPYISDYRPSGNVYEIKIWLNNGNVFFARWDKKADLFIIRE